MITKFEKYLIKESPDGIKYHGTKMEYEDYDASPFFVEVNDDHTEVKRIFIGDNGTSHAEIPYNNGEAYYPGRVWVDDRNKMMSFWVYPNEILFKSILKNLEKELNIKIFNNNWKIEVIKTDDEVEKTYFDPSIVTLIDKEDYYFDGFYNGGKKREIISIEEYIGSENQSEEDYNMHLKKWQDKEKEKKPGEQKVIGFGSDKTALDRPHNIKYRQKIYQEKFDNRI